jgi:hypothetical protein
VIVKQQNERRRTLIDGGHGPPLGLSRRLVELPLDEHFREGLKLTTGWR